HVLEKRSLPDPRLPDHIDMATPVIKFDAEFFLCAAGVCYADGSDGSCDFLDHGYSTTGKEAGAVPFFDSTFSSSLVETGVVGKWNIVASSSIFKSGAFEIWERWR